MISAPYGVERKCIVAPIIMSYYRSASLQKVRGIPDELIVFVFEDATKKKLLARVRVSYPDNPCYPAFVLKPYAAVAMTPNFLGRELFHVWNFLQERAWWLKLDSYNNIVCSKL